MRRAEGWGRGGVGVGLGVGKGLDVRGQSWRFRSLDERRGSEALVNTLCGCLVLLQSPLIVQQS